MRVLRISLPTLLALSGGCAAPDEGMRPVSEDFRDGSYFYVLGYDEHTGTQIRGGAHAVVTFDDHGKTEPIDAQNRPTRFHPDLRENTDFFRFDGVPTQGESDWDVFASTWWPQSKNGTAWRWQPGASQDYDDRSDRDRLSPVEKYDLLFYPGQETTVAAVSHCRYRDYVVDPQNCERIEHPEVTVAGPATKWELENQGVYQWVEPENWWGHCNGWASYATAEPLGYPRRDVRVRLESGRVVECTDGDTEACILFRMADIEALMTELYFSDQATFTGRRCNTAPDEIERDEFGRPTDVACRDLNPGSFHVAITSLLGRGVRSLVGGGEQARPAFVIDHNYDHEVWNFPIIRYEILEQVDVTEQQANALVGANGSDYRFNGSAVAFKRVKLAYWMVSDSVGPTQLLRRADERDVDPVRVELNYVLELDAQGGIVGGEWIEDPVAYWGRDSKELHPDFIWMAVHAQGYGEEADDLGGNGDNPYIAYSKARALLLCANEPETCAPQGGGHGGGDGLLDVTAEVDRDEMLFFDTGEVAAGHYVVTLSHDPDRPGGDADLYVRVGQVPTIEQYDCRPYRDGSEEQCQVNLAAPGTIFVGVRGWALGENAFRLTVTGEGGGSDPPGWEGMDESGTVARNEEDRFGTPELPAGTYHFQMTGTADADLYVRVGSAPTTTQFDCRPYSTGSNETCTVNLAQPGVVHVMVRGYASFSEYRLVGQSL